MISIMIMIKKDNKDNNNNIIIFNIIVLIIIKIIKIIMIIETNEIKMHLILSEMSLSRL